MQDYVRDGAEIYRRSFAIIRSEADLARFSKAEERVAVRLIHACGMVEVARDIVMSSGFADNARWALIAGAPVLCDSKMVANGVTRARLPAAHFSLIMGLDAFRDIATWKGYPDLLDRCHFVVVSRPEVPVSGLRASVAAFADRMIDAPGPLPASPSIVLVDAPTAPVSSTDIRRRVAARESIAGLVPSPVAEHIERHQLYRS